MITGDYRKFGYTTWYSDNSTNCSTADTGTACTYTIFNYANDYCEADTEYEAARDLFMSVIRWLETNFGKVFDYSRYWPILLYFKIYKDSYFKKYIFDKTPERYFSGFV